MTEKEKMLAGKPYKSFGAELLAERQFAKEMIFDYNALRPKETQARNEIIKKLLGKVGRDFLLNRHFAVTMATIFLLAIIFMQIIIVLFWTVPRLRLAIMFFLAQM